MNFFDNEEDDEEQAVIDEANKAISDDENAVEPPPLPIESAPPGLPSAGAAPQDDILKRYFARQKANAEALSNAEKTASENKLLARLGGAVNTAAAGMGGQRADNTAFDAMVKDAENPITRVERANKNATANDEVVNKYMVNKLRSSQLADASKARQEFQAEQNRLNREAAERTAKENREQRAFDAEENRKNRTATSGAAREEKKTIRDEKKNESVREVEQRVQDIESNLDTLDEMIKKNGTYETFGPHNENLNRLIDAVATDTAKLMDQNSVARESEVAAIRKNLIEASATKYSNETARDILKTFKGEMQRRADTAYRVRGLERPKSGAPGGSLKSTAPDQGDLSKFLSPEEAEEFKRLDAKYGKQ